MAYATFEQLMLRYPDLPDMEQARADLKLSDASLLIDQALSRRGRSPEDMDAGLLSMVCCDVAARVLYQSPLGAGMDVSQMSTTVGSISEQFTFSNSGGNMRLLKSDLKNLGISGGVIGFARMGGEADAS